MALAYRGRTGRLGGGPASRKTGRWEEDRLEGEPDEIPNKDLLAAAGPELLSGSPRSAQRESAVL